MASYLIEGAGDDDGGWLRVRPDDEVKELAIGLGSSFALRTIRSAFRRDLKKRWTPCLPENEGERAKERCQGRSAGYGRGY